MKPPFAATVLLLLLLSVAAGQDGMPPAAVALGVVTEEEIRPAVHGVATVEPWRRVVLSAEIAGLVEKYPLREGDPVEAGKTVVCELATTALKIDLEEAEALLARAKAEADAAVTVARAAMEEQQALLDQAENELVRVTDLRKNQVVTQAEFDRVNAEAIAARHRYARAEETWRLAREGTDPGQMALVAEVKRAEARLARVEDQIGKSTIRSPISGRVVRRLVDVGSWITPGTPTVEIVALDPALVRVGVNERDVARIQVGDEAVVRVDAWPERPFAGKVRFITPEADPRSRSFPVLVEVENADHSLLSGMFARVEIRSGEPRKVLTVPKDAVVNGPAGPVVVTLGPKNAAGMPTATFVMVTAGQAVGDRREVSGEGLAAGTPVVTTGNERVMPGQPLIPTGGPGGGPAGPGGGAPEGGAER